MESDNEDNVTVHELEPCETCGRDDFYTEEGFYYCNNCHTQSQDARSFAEEVSFMADTSLRHAKVLRSNTPSEVSAVSEETTVNLLSHWEAFNFALNTLTNRLIEIGFPELLRDRVFLLWTRYLMKRQAILVSTTSVEPSRITLKERRRNVWALYDETPYFKEDQEKRSKIRKQKRKEDQEKKREEDLLENPRIMSLSQKKRKLNIERKKAHEKEYLEHATSMIEEDAAYDSFSLPPLVDEVPRKKQKLRLTEQAEIVKTAMKDYVQLIPFPMTSRCGGITTKEILKASQILDIEQFSFKYVYIILFVALRQLGFNVIFTDIKQLLYDGTLYIRNFDALFPLNLQPYIRSKSNNIFGIHCDEYISLHGSVQDFINYTQIKFRYPKMESFLPKFAQDLVFPDEFNELLEKIVKLYPLGLLMKNIKIHKKFEIFVEVWIVAFNITILKMLFGLDDVTEYYQSEFAQKLNHLIEKAKKRNEKWKDEPMDDIELFDIQQWFSYTRYKKRLIDNELILTPLFNPFAKMNLKKTHQLINTIGKRHLKVKPRQYGDNKTIEGAKNLASMFSEMSKDDLKEWEEPNYMAAPLPTESVVKDFEAVRSKANFPNMRPEFLRKKFEAQRIDFIYNPGKYLPLIFAAGYKLRVIRGDAVNYKKLKKRVEKKNTLLLFQPYKIFDDSIRNDSATMNSLIEHCALMINGSDKRKIEPLCLTIKSHVNFLFETFANRCRLEAVPLIDENLEKMGDYYLTKTRTERQSQMLIKRLNKKREELEKEKKEAEEKAREKKQRKKEYDNERAKKLRLKKEETSEVEVTKKKKKEKRNTEEAPEAEVTKMKKKRNTEEAQ